MSVHQDKRIPEPQTILSALDTQARATMKLAQEQVSSIVSQETPRKSGETAAALRPRVSRTATGAALSVGPPRGKRHGNVTVAQVVRWVNRGTGIYREGPGSKRKIRAKNPLRRMNLGNGVERRSVKGQHPNQFMTRIRERGTLRVEELAKQGAQDAARVVERI